MKRGDIFTFTASNGAEVTAVVIDIIANAIPIFSHITRYLCYAQNRLFTYEEIQSILNIDEPSKFLYGKVLVDYAILPDYDKMLEGHYHQIDRSNDYADKPL